MAPPPYVRHFDAAAGGRRACGFRDFGSHGPEAAAAGATLRARGRNAHANSAWVRNAVGAIVAEAVGAGIMPTSAHPDPAIRARIDERVAAVAPELDAEERTDFYGLQAAMVRAEIVDGEAFAILEDTGEGVRVRHLPAEFVDESDTRELSGGAYVASGVHFSAMGQRTAYTVQPARPTDLFPTARDPIIVPAADVLHVARTLGPGQVRGVSQLAPVLLTLNELDQYDDARLVGAKISAMLCAFVVDLNATSGDAVFDTDADGVGSMEPGTMVRLPKGVDVRMLTPDQLKDGDNFARHVLRQIAAGLGVPTHLVDGDLSDANYSSLRAGLLPYRAKVEQYVYHTLVPQFLDPIFRRVVTTEYLAGRLDLPGFESDPAAFLRVEWLPTRPMQVDPQKDTEAMLAQIGAGLMSRR